MKEMKAWRHFQAHFFDDAPSGLQLDCSAAGISASPDFEPRFRRAQNALAALVAGAPTAPGSTAQAGHFWLRAPQLAPSPAQRTAIRESQAQIEAFAAATLAAGRFRRLLVVGMGGSILGTQMLAAALDSPPQALQPFFLDTADPAAFADLLAALGPDLSQTLVLIVSKSGQTLETRHNLAQLQDHFAQARFDFATQAVAISAPGSPLSQQAKREKWLACFPVWPWVPGRNSLFSAVGLLPLALLKLDHRQLLAGAASGDELARRGELAQNPAYLLVRILDSLAQEQQIRTMVLLPYQQRLALLPTFAQQLFMESLGKEFDFHGQPVRQGLTVYGGCGQQAGHSLLQQLLAGPDDNLPCLIEILPQAAAGSGEDCQEALLLGARASLQTQQRRHLTITLRGLNAFSLGLLIALLEQCVSLYAQLIGVNAYDQPAVEAGKQAAAQALDLKERLLALFQAAPSQSFSALEAAQQLDAAPEMVFKLLQYLSAAAQAPLDRETPPAGDIFSCRYRLRR